MVAELSRISPEFEALWRNNDIVAQGEGVKHLRHPDLGSIELEFSTFAVDGRPDLGMIVYSPATSECAERIHSFIASRRPPGSP